MAGDGVGEGELEEAFGVGRGSGHVQVFGGVRLVEGEGHGRHPGAFGREPSGDGDVAPGELMRRGGGGGDGGGDGDEGDDHVGARGGLVDRSAGGAHDVGVVAGDGVGEGELVVACGVSGGGGYGNPLHDIIGVVEGNGCLGDGSEVGGERSGDGDVAPGELLSGGGGGGDGGREGDVGDDYLGAR